MHPLWFLYFFCSPTTFDEKVLARGNFDAKRESFVFLIKEMHWNHFFKFVFVRQSFTRYIKRDRFFYEWIHQRNSMC
jgi:hypothetical protein